MTAAQHTVLVTGAAGFIGSFVARRLADMGLRVVGCDNFNDYYSPSLKRGRVRELLTPVGVTCENIDLANQELVTRLFKEHKPTHVVHLAAQAGVRYSINNPSAYIQSNLVAFSYLLEACRHYDVQHFVYASSSSVYGASTDVPFHENQMTDSPVSLYAATKKSNELMAYSYSSLFGLAATGLRFFTVYGPWGRPDMAYFTFTEKMLKGESIPVFAGGTLERDFTYIDDIVEGVVRLLFKPQDAQQGKPRHAVFNIGNHQPVQVLRFIAMLEDALGVKASMDFLPMQQGDVPATYADTRQLREWVGFAPATPLDQGLARFCAWYRGWYRV